MDLLALHRVNDRGAAAGASPDVESREDVQSYLRHATPTGDLLNPPKWDRTRLDEIAVSQRVRKPLKYKSHQGTLGFEGAFRVTLFLATRKSLILNGEMSEWSVEHAWKAILATLTE